jgi:tRNA (uracil-5-)-methyltransferase TRM9
MNQREIWNSLAESWNRFRKKPFPHTVLRISDEWKKGKILDLGCGNGRNLAPFVKNGFSCYGVDFSKEMLDNAKTMFKKRKLNAEFKIGDLVKIPFENEFFDYVICVASFHHLNKKEQIECLKEIKRVLKKNGKFYICVWNKWQKKFMFKKKEQYIFWKIKEKVFERYYYFFNIFEFKKLLKKSEFKIENLFGMFKKNIEAICVN